MKETYIWMGVPVVFISRSEMSHNRISSPNPSEPLSSADLVSQKHSFLWSAPQDFPSEHLLDPKVLQDFAAFLEGHKGHDGLKGEAVATYLKEYSKGLCTYDIHSTLLFFDPPCHIQNSRNLCSFHLLF